MHPLSTSTIKPLHVVGIVSPQWLTLVSRQRKQWPPHAPIKLLLKSQFNPLSFGVILTYRTYKTDCDMRDSKLSTLNRLHRDARQKDISKAYEFIGLCEGGRREFRAWWKGWNEENKKIYVQLEGIIAYEYLCGEECRGNKISKEKG